MYYGAPQPTPTFWTQHCPARATDLAHKHEKDCTDGHLDGQCCECGRHAASWSPSDNRPIEDHLFVFTVTGKCVRCQRTKDAHPIELAAPDKQTDCTVDHLSISTARLIDDAGVVWRSCPLCNLQIEPKLAGEGPHGPTWERGRGELDARDKARLGFVAYANRGQH